MNEQHVALADAETLAVAARLVTPREGGDPATSGRKRWFVLAYVNPIATAFPRDAEYSTTWRQPLASIRQQLSS